MKILVIQNSVKQVIEKSFDNIKALVAKAKQKPDFIVLPEMFMSPYETDKFIDYAQNDESEAIKFLKDLAKENQAYIIGGSVPELFEEKLFNTTYIIDPSENIIHKYRKIHLFQIKYPSGKSFNESDVLTQGESLGVFNTKYGKMGVMICFDVRFPYLATKLMNALCQVIFIPGAFNDYTGPLHWQTTLRARAIDNQLFVIGCSPSKTSFGNYNSYGHSIVIDPLGQVIEELDGYEGIIEVTINLNKICDVREKLPIVKNYRSL
jgi:predicted amidohydrolase